ncbi:hypothetical protein E6C76_18355 [Pseudothauera nasutitermitis]|uniref:Uncharacterized protein n=1 Tax=Pseudothauera nasutitermitis TaxID=2565930 RepID=A0A4S4AR68_9RHOO|nr:hypothetical protein [Pseudothauera nasutitermitis]THF62290.1 hypothetical protein E6C76_18355 [Pseudothauera nasutitermitis]
MKRAIPIFALAVLGSAQAAPVVEVCYNYGCVQRAEVRFAPARLEALVDGLRAAERAEEERAALAVVLGGLYRLAGEQTPVGADRAGNLLDAGVEGRMDCIDHSTSTTALLRMLETRGSLRFHRVLEPARRTRFILQHFSAVIEEIEPVAPLAEPVAVPDHVGLLLAACDCAEVLDDIPRPPAPPPGNPGARFVVDSWFVDNGEPAVVLPLQDWLNGEGPNVQ